MHFEYIPMGTRHEAEVLRTGTTGVRRCPVTTSMASASSVCFLRLRGQAFGVFLLVGEIAGGSTVGAGTSLVKGPAIKQTPRQAPHRS